MADAKERSSKSAKDSVKPEAVAAAAVTGVTVAPKTVSLKVGGTQQLTATVEPEDAENKSVGFTSSADEMASVNSTGLVTAVAEGEATITVTTLDGGFTDTSEVSVAALPVVDITDVPIDSWPGNTPHRVGSYYFNLNRIKLQTSQSGLLGRSQDYFVFERADVHGIESPDVDLDIELLLNNTDSLGRFTITQGETIAERETDSTVKAGSYQSKQDIYLKLHGAKPEKGRVLVNLVGYLIEPWR